MTTTVSAPGQRRGRSARIGDGGAGVDARQRFFNSSAFARDPLASHLGAGENLYVGWTPLDAATEAVDVVLHLHGYSAAAPSRAMLEAKVRQAGLDLSRRTTPTVAIVPRGRKIAAVELSAEHARGGHPNASRYTFPGLSANEGEGLELLIAQALQWLAREALHHSSGSLAIGRLIWTAHSGGGIAVNELLRGSRRRRVCDPNEVHLFDAAYGPVDGLTGWAPARLSRHLTAASPGNAGALRIVYRSGTRSGSVAAMASLSNGGLLGRAPREVARLYRADLTTVAHDDIPGRFGPLLLADAAADLPGVSGGAGQAQAASYGTPVGLFHRTIGRARSLEPALEGGPGLAAGLGYGGDWDRRLQTLLESFLTEFMNVPVGALRVHPPYFINEGRTEHGRQRLAAAQSNRTSAPRPMRDLLADLEHGADAAHPLGGRRRVLEGKSLLADIPVVVQAGLDRHAILAGAGRAQPNAGDVRSWLVRYGIGVDCSGFVCEALNRVMTALLGRALTAAEKLNTNSSGLRGPSATFSVVARPDDLCVGDTMHHPGHIRVVTRVQRNADGSVKFATAESSSVGDIGPTGNVWRHPGGAAFTQAPLTRESHGAWEGSAWVAAASDGPTAVTFSRSLRLSAHIAAHAGQAQGLDLDEVLQTQAVTRVGWTRADARPAAGMPAGGWNGTQARVDGIERIPLEGLRQGNQDQDAAGGGPETAASINPVTGAGGTGGRGRAIILIPPELGEGPLDVFLHLHGHNRGYRRPGSGRPRDIDVDRIEAQLTAFGARERRLVAMLPQGTHGSDFGSLDCNSYLDEVRDALGRLGLAGAGAIRSVILSAHSGGGALISTLLSHRSRLPPQLRTLALFDSINGPNELRACQTWTLDKLNEDLAALTAPGRSGNASAQNAFLAASIRLVGMHTPGHYAELYRPLVQAIDRWFSDHRAAALAAMSQAVFDRWVQHYRIVAVAPLLPAGQPADHDHILGRGDMLLRALRFSAEVPRALALSAVSGLSVRDLYVSGAAMPDPSAVVYQVPAGREYGPIFHGTAPPGLPAGARRSSASGAALPFIQDIAQALCPDDVFVSTVRDLAQTESGAMFARPANIFDIRPEGQRNGRPYISAWGCFQFNRGAWRALPEVGASAFPWDATPFEELVRPLRRYAGIFSEVIAGHGTPIDAARGIRLWHRSPTAYVRYIRRARASDFATAWNEVAADHRTTVDRMLHTAHILGAA